MLWDRTSGKTGMDWRDDLKMLGKLSKKRQVVLRSAPTVEQQEWRSGSPTENLEIHAV
jgi:hypothetical protein